MQKDLTTGSVLKTVMYFSLPYLLSYFLQTLYGMADLFIIGQFNGAASTTAVSIGSQIMHMFTVMIVGLAMGATVMIGRATGAKDYKRVSLTIGNTITLFMTLSIFLMIMLLVLVRPIVSIMATPDKAVNGTVTYLTICFIGIPFIVAYNIISSIFRGMGNSKSPMYFIAVACIVNIFLDYIFIGLFKFGAAGAALGTTLSQAISVIFSLFFIKIKKEDIHISFKHLKPQKDIIINLIKIGAPVALQDGFIQISFIVITIFANRRGLNDAAAVGIVEKIISILFLVPSSMLSTVSALGAQNIGARKHERARKTLLYAIIIAVVFGTVTSIIIQFTAINVTGLFTHDKEVAILGGGYLRSYVWDCLLAGIHFSFSGYFYAYGLSTISFMHNFISIICARIPLSYIASKYFTASLFPMGIAPPMGSLLSVIICIIVFIWTQKHYSNMTN